MKITRRQEEFISKLFDLYREFQEPIHYSTLAEHLGVSRFTAYDMLTMLEEKGMVKSEYRLAAEKSGPGRTVRVFLPTRLAHDCTSQLSEEIDDVTGETFKQHVLIKMRKGEIQDMELAEEMIARIPPEGHSQIRYCVEVMTIAGLRLRKRDGRRYLVEYLPAILPSEKEADRSSLCLLGGFLLGIIVDEGINDREWGEQLFEHIQRYLNLTIEMSADHCHQLGDHLREVFAPLQEKK